MNLHPLDLVLILITAADIAVIATRRDVRIAAILTTAFLLALALKELLVQNSPAFAAMYFALSIITLFQSRHVFKGDKKGQWRNWPWY